VGSSILLLVPIVLENGVADRNALIANIGARIIRRRGNQLSYNILTLMTKGTPEGIIGTGTLHRGLLVGIGMVSLIIANFWESA